MRTVRPFLFTTRSAGAGATSSSAGTDRSRALEARVDALERRNETLSLACQALWELLCESGGMNDETLFRKMQEVDLRDGTADGKITPRPITCPACRRNSRSGRMTCVYCGASLPGQGNPFEIS